MSAIKWKQEEEKKATPKLPSLETINSSTRRPKKKVQSSHSQANGIKNPTTVTDAHIHALDKIPSRTDMKP